jgi:hypothetical protein
MVDAKGKNRILKGKKKIGVSEVDCCDWTII